MTFIKTGQSLIIQKDYKFVLCIFKHLRKISTPCILELRSLQTFVQGKKVLQCVSNNIKSNMSDSKYVDIQYSVNSIG